MTHDKELHTLTIPIDLIWKIATIFVSVLLILVGVFYRGLVSADADAAADIAQNHTSNEQAHQVLVKSLNTQSMNTWIICNSVSTLKDKCEKPETIQLPVQAAVKK